MRPSRRLLRGLAIGFAVLGVAGFGAFSTYFFNPFEGGLGVDAAGLVDRNVDFFLARADLSRTLSPFPRLAIEPQLEQHPAWRLFSGSPEKAELYAQLGVEDALRELEALAAQMPLGLSPLQVFGGRDLALAGHFNGPDLASSNWAVYGTLNWAGKLAIELLRHPGLARLDRQGMQAVAEEGWVRLSGGQLQREIFVARIKDVGIVASTSTPIVAARERAANQFQDSMLLRAEYSDHVLVPSRSPRRDELELWVDLRDLFKNLGVPGAWPDPKSDTFLPAFLARFFQANLVNYLVGTLGVRGGLSLDLAGQLSSERMTPLQTRTYQRSSADHDELRRQVATLAPADTSLLVYMRVDIGDLLREVVASLGPDVRQILSDAFRQTGQYRDVDQVIELLASCLRSRIAIIVRPNDYPEDPSGPPHDDSVVPAIAVVTWLNQGKAPELERLRDTIGGYPQIFGLRGRTEGDRGYYSNIEGGYETREFWQPLIPGTGVIATTNAGEHCIITNSHRMLAHIMRTYTVGPPTFPRLSERGDFEGLLASSVPRATLALWANPRTLGQTLRAMSKRWAKDSIVIDWKAERAAVEREVVQRSFPQHLTALSRGGLPPELRAQVDAEVNPILEQRQREIEEARLPAVEARYLRLIEYGEAVQSAMLLLGLDPKRLDFSLRVVAPLTQ